MLSFQVDKYSEAVVISANQKPHWTDVYSTAGHEIHVIFDSYRANLASGQQVDGHLRVVRDARVLVSHGVARVELIPAQYCFRSSLLRITFAD
jgi:hypothetical protein